MLKSQQFKGWAPEAVLCFLVSSWYDGMTLSQAVNPYPAGYLPYRYCRQPSSLLR